MWSLSTIPQLDYLMAGMYPHQVAALGTQEKKNDLPDE
jgi:hypothetical protein